jgi:hypothetical protein
VDRTPPRPNRKPQGWTAMARKAGTWLRAEVAELKAEASLRTLSSCSDQFATPPNANSVSQAHGRIHLSPA